MKPNEKPETFGELRQRYDERFTTYKFELPPDTNISMIVDNSVPNERDIYFVFDGLGCEGIPVYIGKAGTLKNNVWLNQGLRDRLKALQGRIPRNKFFRDRINRQAIAGMSFLCFKTMDDKNALLPHAAEANAMQAYLEEYKQLPILNTGY